MKLCVDVAYEANTAHVAGLVFQSWQDSDENEACVFSMPIPGKYVPGEFYRRELPCILALLDRIQADIDVVVVDGYVWLAGGPGLGGHLFDALDQNVEILGVAKNPFRNAVDFTEIYRGTSKQPLYISSAGIAIEDAAEAIREMHGKFRIPTLLKRVDRLCRDFSA